MNNNPTIKPQVVNSPFTNFCMSIGAIPTSYKDSLDYYETLLWLIKFLDETVIPAVTTNGNAVAELQGFYLQLQSYVNNYFDNLDVQEEINNKLDDLVEQGTLQEIIADYLNSKAVFGYDNVNSMKNSTNLIDGSYAQTLGYYEANDGGSALYKIREVTNSDVIDEMFIIALNDNTLIAELILSDDINVLSLGIKNNGIDDITSKLRTAITKVNKLYFPSGEYKLTEKVVISNSITIHGDGAKLGRGNYNPKTIIISPTNDYAFKTTYPTLCFFEKICFQGNGIDELAGNCVECDFIGDIGVNYLRGRIDKCYFDCTTYGIYTAVDSVITNSTFGNCGVAISLHGSDNRIINNRFDWNNLGIELISASYNTITNNIFDRNTTYGITSTDSCFYNNINNNLFERNLISHLSGDFYYTTISSNKFVKKIIIDGDETSEKLPTTAFNFTKFGYNIFNSNQIYADKFVNSQPSFINGNTISGNSFNDYNVDKRLIKLGDVTVNANSTNTLNVLFSNLKSNLLNFGNGAHFELDFIKVIIDGGSTRFYSGDERIKQIYYDPYYNIQINLANNTSNQTTYHVYAQFKDIDIFYINFTN